jgi:hypothetical protein
MWNEACYVDGLRLRSYANMYTNTLQPLIRVVTDITFVLLEKAAKYWGKIGGFLQEKQYQFRILNAFLQIY